LEAQKGEAAMKDNQVFEAVNAALDEHIKYFDAFMNAMEHKWPTATAQERNQMQHDFVSLMRRAGQIAQLMDGDQAAPN
jgi:hypothetical protein